ncbi:MAG: hypothetical protein RL065_568 [Bacteroidota bacterium]
MTKRTLQQFFVLFSVVLSVVFASNSFGQITITEGFESTTFAPTGWRISPMIIGGPGGNQIWRRTTPAGTNPTANPYAGLAMGRFDSRNNAAGSTQNLISPVIDYSGRGSNSTNVSLWVYRDTSVSAQGDSITVWMNTIDTTFGATRIGAIARSTAIALPQTEASIGWYQYSFAVPSSFNGATNYFILQGTSQRIAAGGGPANTGRNIFIDDVSWTPYPPACAGTPNVGSIVNSTNVICGGSGSATLSLTSPITNASGLTYNWQTSSSATGAFTTLSGSTNSVTASTGILSSPTTVVYYQCSVTCSNSGLTYTTPVDSIMISNAALPVVSGSPTVTSLCSGTTTSLNATGAGIVNFTWSSTNAGLNSTTGSSVTATPPAGGGFGGGTRIIVITGTDALGCTDTAQVRLIVSNSPNANITSSIANDSICIGQTLILTMPNIGGGPGGGGTYSWTPSGKTTRNDTIVGTTAGTIQVIGTATSNATGCSSSDTVIVTVNSGTAPTVSVTPSTATYCVGGAGVTLTASGTGTTYSWTPSATLNTSTGTTVVASPVGGGGPGGGTTVYTVTASNGVCSSSATATVTRSNPPTATMTTNIAANDSMCMGTLILTGPNGGGFGGALTYNWSNGITTRRDTIVMNTVGSFPYTLIVTNTGGCSDTISRTITVLNGTQPVLTVTPSTTVRYCTLTSTSATVTIKGATSYTWNNTNGVTFLSSSNDSASVTPAGGPGGGNYTITGTTGLCTSTVTITVAAVNPPNPGAITNINPGVDTVCAGATVVLRAQGGGFGGGYTYMWDDGKTFRNDTIIVNNSGWTHVVVSSAPGCSVIDSIQLVVGAGSANFTYTADSTFVQFTDLSVGSISWTWDFGDTTALDFTQNPTHNYAHHGLYNVILTVIGPCGTYTDTMQVGAWASGINNIETNNIYAYPNPVKDMMNLSFRMNSNNAEMTIINALGQVMETKSITSKSTNGFNEKISMLNYPNGVYSIKVKSNNELLTIKVIKSNN